LTAESRDKRELISRSDPDLNYIPLKIKLSFFPRVLNPNDSLLTLQSRANNRSE